MFNHAALFGAIAAVVPDRPALVAPAHRATYGELQERANQVGNLLLSHGLGIRRPRAELAGWESGQDHVGLYLHNGHEYLESTLGAFLARTAPFNVNYRYVADELAHLLDDAEAAALVFHERFAPTLEQVLPRLARRPLLLQVADGSGHGLVEGALDYEAALARQPTVTPATTPHPDDLLIQYTGGTTGLPKGTLWTQGDLFEASVGIATAVLRTGPITEAELASALAAAPAPVYLPLAPLMHGSALWAALAALLSGGTVAFPAVVDRLDPAAVWEAVARERVMVVSVVGDAFARPLCEELERGDHDVSSLVAFMSGGATLSPKVQDRLQRLLPGVRVVDGAGASETGTHGLGIDEAGEPLPPGVFRAAEGTVVVDDAKAAVLPAGHDGIGWLARSGHIPLGYLGDPEKTARTFPVVEGRAMVVPGDRARQLPGGLIELLGRDAVTINTGGEKVFAEEVEQALVDHPDVDDCLVVGRPSDRWGNEVVALVQLRPGGRPSDDELLAGAGQHLASFKLPKAIIRVPAVQRGPAGKADYAWARAVAEHYAEGRPA